MESWAQMTCWLVSRWQGRPFPASPTLSEFDDWDEDAAMPSDLRPSTDAHDAPLLGRKSDAGEGEGDAMAQAQRETRRKYTYAGVFLVLSLVSFTVQTETAVYIQHELKWEKPFCMLYMTHGSWIVLWPVQLLLLRLQNRAQPWATFWRRHTQLLRQTALMVQHQTLQPTARQSQASAVPYMLKMTAFITCALTLAGGSWYVAVNQTTASDLTAIYNCSAFFAYAFSIPLLHERVRASKLAAVAIAVAGVFVVAYGDSAPAKHGSKSGGGAGGDKAPPSRDAENRAFGNLVIGVGSVLYGLYEVLYKRLACPPEGASADKAILFANTFGSLIGAFTLAVLWIPLPILHYTGWETFELPRGEQAWMMAVSVLANATFSGSFLVLISLTSPVLSSVAALLTIFIVAIVDQLLPPPLNSPLTSAAILGGLLIIGAFLLLSWATYKEMDEERRHKLEESASELDD
ncbi:uncharacterized protein M421DRAFT_101675 [Didymella exigua CBS 183.55]|uniref:Uncharacterized protein n=1 Tax=Didymella exigua CBS 183.55 TaxID=1150837 RepID=A0A6A5RN25_9PLEO|nr:uncharacterized protein M421DRAFT_101675 [Didymella exigua CBS 183.55]KAF1927756.1 hypothetical protein M421DRAFT_101675 [Didymella exigua CBS 183.55]